MKCGRSLTFDTRCYVYKYSNWPFLRSGYGVLVYRWAGWLPRASRCGTKSSVGWFVVGLALKYIVEIKCTMGDNVCERIDSRVASHVPSHINYLFRVIKSTPPLYNCYIGGPWCWSHGLLPEGQACQCQPRACRFRTYHTRPRLLNGQQSDGQQRVDAERGQEGQYTSG